MLIALIASLQVGAAQPANPLEWMTGYWLMCDGDREVSETWVGPFGYSLEGVGVTAVGGQIRNVERMRIYVTESGPFFVATIGETSTSFRGTMGDQRMTFENAQNDFPTRVIYSREGDVLTGRIEGTIDGQAQSMEWTYQAAELNTRCPET